MTDEQLTIWWDFHRSHRWYQIGIRLPWYIRIKIGCISATVQRSDA